MASGSEGSAGEQETQKAGVRELAVSGPPSRGSPEKTVFTLRSEG